MMFDITKIPMQIEKPEDGSPVKVVIDPADVYPAIIVRIQEVLKGGNPSELLASAERGGSARADILVKNARALPEPAWSDALLPREEFTPLPYASFVERNGLARADLLNALDQSIRAAVERMIYRGYALEIAYGWFCQALRLEYGAYDLTINRDEAYRL